MCSSRLNVTLMVLRSITPDGQIEHGRHVGVGEIDVAACHCLSQNAAAVKVNRFDVDAVFVPEFFLFDDPAEISVLIPAPL